MHRSMTLQSQAAHFWPGRKPGVCDPKGIIRPGGATEFLIARVVKIFCRPLKWARGSFGLAIPGLTPGATLCRRLRRLIEGSFPSCLQFQVSQPRFETSERNC